MDRELVIIVSEEDARFIEQQVSTGASDSASAVIRAGLDELRRAEELAQPDKEWLRAKVQEALDDPRPPVPAEDAFERVRAHIARREAGR